MTKGVGDGSLRAIMTWHRGRFFAPMPHHATAPGLIEKPTDRLQRGDDPVLRRAPWFRIALSSRQQSARPLVSWFRAFTHVSSMNASAACSSSRQPLSKKLLLGDIGLLAIVIFCDFLNVKDDLRWVHLKMMRSQNAQALEDDLGPSGVASSGPRQVGAGNLGWTAEEMRG